MCHLHGGQFPKASAAHAANRLLDVCYMTWYMFPTTRDNGAGQYHDFKMALRISTKRRAVSVLRNRYKRALLVNVGGRIKQKRKVTAYVESTVPHLTKNAWLPTVSPTGNKYNFLSTFAWIAPSLDPESPTSVGSAVTGMIGLNCTTRLPA